MASSVPYPEFWPGQISRSPLVAEFGSDDRAGFILSSGSTGRYWHATSSIQQCLYGEVFRAVEVGRSMFSGAWEQLGWFAIKKMSLRMVELSTQAGVAEDPFKEVAALQYLKDNGSHPNVINISEALRDADYIYVVLPYCHGGELFTMVNLRTRLSERNAQRMFRDILAGMAFLHSLGICHRDMSLENILLDETGQAKIIDLGMALMVGQPRGGRNIDCLVVQGGAGPGGRRTIPPTGPCGKKGYMAPEVAMNEQAFDGLAVDVWACGVILFIMLSGIHPFGIPIPAQDRRCSIIAVDGRLYDLIQEMNLPISEEAASLIQSCLMFNPRDRATVEDLLQHPWLEC